ncbi:DUF4031 domain-containing protein [Deinococcus ficus]|uniref:DUF4031 domain-containing protein n=1 Tax=Deinococcus ficus TaxID=317577 RepID=A0A221T3B5_9DEIO|nr:DUF4031 domain-containing protein [Deinococcus ficus]ASN83392.1 hypothetical protein DFI_19535 [Deinococcus ficus]
MTVYVDEIKDYQGAVGGHVGRVNQRWCHLTADTLDELHAMAAKIGLKRSWFQSSHLLHHCHYDLTPGKRAAAVRAGAVEVKAMDRARHLAAAGTALTPSGLPGRS